MANDEVEIQVDFVKCVLCECRLNNTDGDCFEQNVCGVCQLHPDAEQYGFAVNSVSRKIIIKNGITKLNPWQREPRESERQFIKSHRETMTVSDMVATLNQRIINQLGSDALLFTEESIRHLIRSDKGNVLVESGTHSVSVALRTKSKILDATPKVIHKKRG